MTPEQKAAFIFSCSISAQIEMEGMKAENLFRERQGQSPAYGEDAFFNLIKKHGIEHNSIINFFLGD